MHYPEKVIDHAALIKRACRDINVLTQYLNTHPDAINAQDNFLNPGVTLIHYVLKSCHLKSSRELKQYQLIIKTLLSYNNINLNTKDINNDTPLHSLLEKNMFFNEDFHLNPDYHQLLSILFSLLKGHKIDTTHLNRMGYSILHVAAQAVEPMLLKRLLPALDYPNIDGLSSDGATALAYAVKTGRIENIRTLLQAGANPSIHDNPEYDVLTLLPDYFDYLDLSKTISHDSTTKTAIKKSKAAICDIIDNINAAKLIQQRFKSLLKVDVRHLKKHLAADINLVLFLKKPSSNLLCSALKPITATLKLLRKLLPKASISG